MQVSQKSVDFMQSVCKISTFFCDSTIREHKDEYAALIVLLQVQVSQKSVDFLQSGVGSNAIYWHVYAKYRRFSVTVPLGSSKWVWLQKNFQWCKNGNDGSFWDRNQSIVCEYVFITILTWSWLCYKCNTTPTLE